jgi:hypothetical protein
MIEKISQIAESEDDVQLRMMLTQYDAVVPMSSVALAALKADIFAHIDGLEESNAAASSKMPGGLLPRDLTARAAAFASVLVVAVGFIVGHTGFGDANLSVLGSSSLLAFADDAAWQSISETNTAWGASDDSAD